jgi:hypothetical protein
MIGLALKLSASGVGDYWDDADRWIRNQFAECQMQRSDWLYRLVEGDRVATRRRVLESWLRPDPGQYTTDHVPERLIGTFASWPSANDFFSGHENGIMNCCTGNGTRALYYIWENMITYRAGELRVNLLLNRPSRWADVLSYIPYQGEVEVQVKEPCRLKVRIPDWTQPSEAMCTVDGKERALGWDGRYAVVGAVNPRQDVHLHFPIRERIVETDIEKQHYLLTIRGNDVVRIDPPGRYCPFYQRDYYRQGKVLWEKAERFVSDEDIAW